MTTALDQQRVTLKNLKVADFASQETLCFSATVVFDGEAIAEANNDGHGGATYLYAREGKRDRLDEAEAFAASLPPEVTEFDDPQDSSRRFTIDFTLEYLVDSLAIVMHEDRRIRASFNRHMASKVMYVRDGKLMYLKNVKLKTVTDRADLFARLRARHPEPITILAELPADEAFTLWKRLAVDDGES